MRRIGLAVLVLVLGAAGCGGDPSDVTASDLYGLWGAISMVYTSHADPAVSLDYVGTEGGAYSIQLISGGRYESQLSGPGTGTVRVTGEFQVREGRLHLHPDDGLSRTLTVDFNQSLLTLREADSAWDFNRDGTVEAARLEMVLDRF